ncbi:CvpA family protein [Candidatus Latescibacterota bacterium]
MVNYFDILVLIIMLGLAVSGFFEGLIRGVIKLIGFIAVIVFLSLFSDIVIEMAVDLVNLPAQIAVPLVFFLFFATSAVVVYFIAEILHELIKLTPIRIIDSGLGSVFGLLKAFCITGILAMLLSFTSPGTFLNDQYVSSRSGVPLNDLFGTVVPFLKSEIIPIYRKYIPLEFENELKKGKEGIEKNDRPDVI